jgi:hypothetical protein
MEEGMREDFGMFNNKGAKLDSFEETERQSSECRMSAAARDKVEFDKKAEAYDNIIEACKKISKAKKLKLEEDKMKFWKPNQNIIDMDIYGLMGSKITVINGKGEEVPGVIAGADPYIGFSVVRQEDPKKVLLCVHGPYSPGLRVHFLDNPDLQNLYNRLYPIAIKNALQSIETGLFDTQVVMEAMGDPDCSAKEGCPFGV